MVFCEQKTLITYPIWCPARSAQHSLRSICWSLDYCSGRPCRHCWLDWTNQSEEENWNILNYHHSIFSENYCCRQCTELLMGDLLDALRCRYRCDAQDACVTYAVTRSDRRFGVETQHAHLAHVPVAVADPHVSLVQRRSCTRKLQASPGLSYGYRADEISIRSPVRGQDWNVRKKKRWETCFQSRQIGLK